MRFTYLILTVLAVGVSAGRRAPVVESSGRPAHVIKGHFGWGMPMDEAPVEDKVKEGTCH